VPRNPAAQVIALVRLGPRLPGYPEAHPAARSPDGLAAPICARQPASSIPITSMAAIGAFRPIARQWPAPTGQPWPGSPCVLSSSFGSSVRRATGKGTAPPAPG